MKFTFLLITIIINFFNPLIVKSEEEIDSQNIQIKSTDNVSNINRIHIVKEGDTISSISNFYLVDKKLIIRLNDLKDENYIFVGQNLIISNNNQNSLEKRNVKIQNSNNFHIVQTGESLTEISNKYKLKLEYLININNLKDPDSIKVGKKLLLNKNKKVNKEIMSSLIKTEINQSTNIDKKVYGPLKIESSQYKVSNGRKILNIRNQKDKKLILAIKCKTKELDVRIPGRQWSGLQPAKEEFEKNLINDLC